MIVQDHINFTDYVRCRTEEDYIKLQTLKQFLISNIKCFQSHSKYSYTYVDNKINSGQNLGFCEFLRKVLIFAKDSKRKAGEKQKNNKTKYLHENKTIIQKNNYSEIISEIKD